jgi:hypothetical protein
MQALTDMALLGIWDRGQDRSPVDRGLLLLAAALPKLDAECRADLSIGERDAAILRLRQVTLGRQLPGCAVCPRCGERLEFELDAEHLLAELPQPAPRELNLGGGLRFRLPSSRDLATAAQAGDVDEFAHKLLQLCCVDPPAISESPPGALLADIEARLASEDLADIQLRFDCIACGEAWAEHLDIVSYFWEEIGRRARRLLDDVHWLAVCYGWTEGQILALSDARRDAYLQRCGA